MQLEEFFNYKNKLMEEIITDEEIVKLINENVPFEEAASLCYTQVFPFEYIPETEQEGRTFVCFDVDVQKQLGRPLYEPSIYVWVFAHKSALRLPEGGVRVDKLCSKICDKLNGSLYYGQGRLDLESTKRFAVMTDYQGKMLVFYARDVSKLYDGSKQIPTNRRSGA